ncbi:MAG: XTP/dITP diphosphatase [Thermodesulfobacteriota bacterium]
MKVVVATRNMGKVREIIGILRGLDLDILTLEDLPHIPPPEENGTSFKENALKKARYYARYTHMPVIADDSGLEVDFLEKRPGVFSARYAGEGATDEENNRKLLEELKGVPQDKRGAHYVCIIALVLPSGGEETFEGRCNGFIGEGTKGSGGFGYDPVFYLSEYGKTLAELRLENKHRISHRGKALAKLKQRLLKIS